VAESRQLMRSIEENALLRMFVQSTVLERLRPLTQGPGALVGERTEATVVFLRIPEFTSLVRQLPPDAVIQRLNDNFQVLIPELTSRGGMVDRLMGDSALVVFRGQEHLRQALDACMGARQQLKARATAAGEQSAYTLGIGFGVDSGEVVLGGIGGPELGRLDYTMVGIAVDNAARLSAMATTGELLINDRICQRVRLDFECKAAGSRTLPGLREPVAVHDVVSRRHSFLSTSRASGLPGGSDGETPQLGSAMSAKSAW
jgi:class 3 adenylate cyclase